MDVDDLGAAFVVFLAIFIIGMIGYNMALNEIVGDCQRFEAFTGYGDYYDCTIRGDK